MKISYLMLGGNIGDRINYLSRSIELLGRDAGKIVGKSAIYESEPWGFDDSRWFLNQVVVLETNLVPLALLEIIRRIEQIMGRERTNGSYQARAIDIDILLYDNQIINTPELVIPHPLMAERMFVLMPMAELAPNLSHPVLYRTMAYLKEHCNDTKQVELKFKIEHNNHEFI